MTTTINLNNAFFAEYKRQCGERYNDKPEFYHCEHPKKRAAIILQDTSCGLFVQKEEL